MPNPTLGRIVNYTTATGNVVTAQVVCTEQSHAPGRYVNRMSPEARSEAIAGDRSRFTPDGINPAALDVDGDEWIASPVPKPKRDAVHLKITAPNGNTYVEFNVLEDYDHSGEPDTAGTPGSWHFPPQVADAPVEDEVVEVVEPEG